MTDENTPLHKVVNRAGYAFVLGVAATIKNSGTRQKWTFDALEVPWSGEDGEGGFIDLTITRGRAVGVVECKKVNHGDQLVFLLPGDSENESRCRLDVYNPNRDVQSGTLPQLADRFGTVECNMVTGSPESAFCASSKGGKPKDGQRSENPKGKNSGAKDEKFANLDLDRIASNLLASCVGLLGDWSIQLDHHTACVPIVVTNADLFTCRFDPVAIDLVSGDLPANAVFKPVSFVRFRKAFRQGAGVSTADAKRVAGAVAEGERTVFVVNAAHLVPFLAGLRYVTCQLDGRTFVFCDGD